MKFGDWCSAHFGGEVGHLVSPVLSLFQFLSTWLVDPYLSALALQFELFAKGWVEEVFERPVHEASRPDQVDDLHLFF